MKVIGSFEESRELLSLNGRKWTYINAYTKVRAVSDYFELLKSIPASVEKLEVLLISWKVPKEYEFLDLQFP